MLQTQGNLKILAKNGLPQTSSLKVFVEGYGCSANLAETEQIKGFFKEHATLESKPAKADLIVVNSCGVKRATEFKMSRRVQKLRQLNSAAQIIVS